MWARGYDEIDVDGNSDSDSDREIGSPRDVRGASGATGAGRVYTAPESPRSLGIPRPPLRASLRSVLTGSGDDRDALALSKSTRRGEAGDALHLEDWCVRDGLLLQEGGWTERAGATGRGVARSVALDGSLSVISGERGGRNAGWLVCRLSRFLRSSRRRECKILGFWPLAARHRSQQTPSGRRACRRGRAADLQAAGLSRASPGARSKSRFRLARPPYCTAPPDGLAELRETTTAHLPPVFSRRAFDHRTAPGRTQARRRRLTDPSHARLLRTARQASAGPVRCAARRVSHKRVRLI